MSIGEKILEELKTPEGKQKVIDWFEKYNREVKEKEIKMKEIISDDQYISWLAEFTKDNLGFHDDEWLYCPEKISAENLKNVERLHLFYSAIEKYANENYIYPTPTDFGNYYSISYNNIGFLIGIMMGQGTIFNCERTLPGEGFIKFEDIQSNKKNEKTDFISQKLQLLANMIDTMAEENVPLEAIEDTTVRSIERIVKKRRKK